MEEITQTEGSDNTVYEIGFLLTPSTTEERLPEAFGALKNVIVDMGAVAISEEFPKLLTLAYTMEKTINNKIERFKEGYFGWIKFEMEGTTLAKLEATLRLRDDVIRHLIVKTVRENTLASKRSLGVRRRPGADVKDNAAAPEMSKEEIDREIEALVDDKAVA
ncbi:MAG: 30S ribosomal protein S6 [Candidatus Pacebacteria bacterium]|nr:30S ribosomal protein S6 [Candidatus Paceibacterota bacterium]